MGIKQFEVDGMIIGSNFAEIYFKVGEVVIILPPVAAKRLLADLRSLDLPADPLRREESVPKRIIKALFKSRKVTRNLISVNTGRKKKLPFG